jgi:hypothetical protein
MTDLLQKPWFVVVIAVVVLAIAAYGGASALTLKKNVLTEVMPGLLTGLIGIAAITERATAVINDVWFGPRRTKAEDEVRLVNRKVNETAGTVEAVRSIAADAAKAGDISLFTATATTLADPVAKHEAEIKQTDKTLAQVAAEETYARLSLAFLIALVVSAVGVRTLASMFETATMTDIQHGVFRLVDIIMTAGVLTGGTAGISAISELLGTYVNASRKRALENP